MAANIKCAHIALLAVVKITWLRRHRVAHSLCLNPFHALKDSKIYPHLLIQYVCMYTRIYGLKFTQYKTGLQLLYQELDTLSNGVYYVLLVRCYYWYQCISTGFSQVNFILRSVLGHKIQ